MMTRIRTLALLLLGIPIAGLSEEVEMWRGLIVAPEAECPAAADSICPEAFEPYDRAAWGFYRGAVLELVKGKMKGVVRDPYTGVCHASTDGLDVEHVVSLAEAHRSGLWEASAQTKRAFARDLLNLTLTDLQLNREKSDRDAAGWTPEKGRCWFAWRNVLVRREWGMTVDRAEANALETIISGCSDNDKGLEVSCPERPAPPRPGETIP